MPEEEWGWTALWRAYNGRMGFLNILYNTSIKEDKGMRLMIEILALY